MLSRRLFKLGGLLLASAAWAAAGPYFVENFDLVGQGLKTYSGTNVPVGTNFVLTAGSVDVIGSAYFPGLCWAPAANTCVDLNGTNPGTLVSTPFDLPAGTFSFSFVLNGTGPTRPRVLGPGPRTRESVA